MEYNIFDALGIPEEEKPSAELEQIKKLTEEKCAIATITLENIADPLYTFYVSLAKKGFNHEGCMEFCQYWMSMVLGDPRK
jgi:hypothetical protein